MPSPDPRTEPSFLGTFLHAVGILLGYGRHLAITAQHRATAPNFTSIAACFGTARLPAILARVRRGILRAMALERVLRARVATGRDARTTEPRQKRAAKQAAAAAPATQTAAAPQAAAPPARHAPRPAGSDDPERYLPTLEELEAQVRRRPYGRTLVDICLDLGVVPGVCDTGFWNELFDLIRCFGGSVARLVNERRDRETALLQEQDRHCTSDWKWWEATRETVRGVLGFFVGEDPVDPFATAPALPAALATGPP